MKYETGLGHQFVIGWCLCSTQTCFPQYSLSTKRRVRLIAAFRRRRNKGLSSSFHWLCLTMDRRCLLVVSLCLCSEIAATGKHAVDTQLTLIICSTTEKRGQHFVVGLVSRSLGRFDKAQKFGSWNGPLLWKRWSRIQTVTMRMNWIFAFVVAVTVGDFQSQS